MGSIVGQDLREYVIKQINVRQKAHGSGVNKERTLEELTYLNSKTAWVKLASGVSVTAEKLKLIGFNDIDAEAYQGQGLARSFILFNGTSQIADFGNENTYSVLPIEYKSPIPSGYNSSPDYGIFPMAGITDVTVSALNRGSLKKATLKLKVQDRQQLAIIDILYLRLGYTVLLEWGNSVFLNNSGELEKVYDTILEQKNKFFSDSFTSTSYSDILETINNQRETYAANYDGMLAKVSNFSWTFNNDGSYDVDLTLISWGDVIESLKTNVTANRGTIDFVEQTPIYSQNNSLIQVNRKENVIFSLLHAFKVIEGTPASGGGGVGEAIKIDNIEHGKFIPTGSNVLNITEEKIQFTVTHELYEWSPNKEHKIVDKTQFGWFKINFEPDSKFYSAVKNGYPKFELGYSIGLGTKRVKESDGFSRTEYIYQNYKLRIREDSTNPNKYTEYTKETDFPQWTKKEESKAVYVGGGNNPTHLPISLNPDKNPLTYTFAELFTRANGNPEIANANVKIESRGIGRYDEIFKLNNRGEYQGFPPEYINGKIKILPEYKFSFVQSVFEAYEFTSPNNLVNWALTRDWPSISDGKISARFYVSLPQYVFGINTRIKDLEDGISDVMGRMWYSGLQSKFGTDDGNLWGTKTTISKTLDAPEPALQSIKTLNDPNIENLINTSFETFKSENADPSLLVPPPKYDPDTGLPKDNNYEFFHRFVAKNQDEADGANKGYKPKYGEVIDYPKPFFWKTSYESKQVKKSSASYSNPLTTLKSDPKGIFFLNTDPKAYYIKFGFLLYLIQEKVIFRIDEQKPIHNENSPIINIDYSSSADMFCINSENTGQVSYDWKTCIVRRDKFTKPWTTTSTTPAKSQTVFPELDFWAEEDDTNSKQRKSVANAMNVYLNFDFVGECFKSNTDERGNIAVYGVINSICAGINKSLGGVNNLEPVIDETTNTLKIIDTTPKYTDNPTILTEKRSEPYLLKLYGYSRPLEFDAGILAYYPNNQFPYYESTFARKVDLKTAITPEYATMITVGAAAGSSGYVKGTEATSFAKWNEGIYDRFKPSLIPGDPDLASTGSSTSSGGGAGIEDTLQSYQQSMNASPQCFGLTP